MNKVALVGRLTKDVELRGKEKKAFAKFTVAVNRPFKNENGDYDADFISCTAFGKTAEFVEEWFSKGDPIGITGRIQTGSYESKNGDTVYTTDVVVDSAEFVCSKKDSDSKKPDRPKKYRDDDNDEEYERPKKKRKPQPEDEDEDDDYPF